MAVLILIPLLALSIYFNLSKIMGNDDSGKSKGLFTLAKEAIAKSLSNRRRSYRINFMDEKQSCYLTVINVGDEGVIEPIEGKGRLVDISGTGMRVTFDKHLPVRDNVIVIVKFALEEDFKLEGQVVRKTETYKDSSITYGIDFKKISVVDESRLIRIIMSFNRDKKRSLINDRRKLKRTL
jgi:c-di-GMP-binding flagellar brake protein YcgR